MNKPLRYVYALLLPIVTIVLLLFIAPKNVPPGSDFLNLARLYLCACFCFLYWRLSRISNYSHYPNIHWEKADIGPKEKFVYLFMAVVFSGGYALITCWIFKRLLLQPDLVSSTIALINGLIILYPMATNYWVFKL